MSAPVMLITPPRKLPVGHLSVSSMALWMKCQERWRRRYMENAFEPVSTAAMLGSAVGGAERDSWAEQLTTGHRLGTAEVLDAFSDGWELQVERARDTGGIGADDDDEPLRAVHYGRRELARIKDSGARVLPLYHQTVAPTVKPIAVERKFVVYPADVDWTFEGYFDVEEEDRIPDLKTRSRSKGVVTKAEASSELQPTGYMWARRAEGNPASLGFAFHSLVRQTPDSTPRPADVAITETYRTPHELDAFGRLLYAIAAQIAWAAEYDVWTPAPRGAWWCSQTWCGFHATCPYGGLHALDRVQAAPRPARKPSASRVREAVEATASKAKGPMNGLTTATKVARYLGVSTRQAANMLGAEVRSGRVESRKAPKSARGTAKRVRHYALAVRWPADVDKAA